MKELFFRNAGKALIPINADGEEALASYPIGVTLRVKVVQPRSTPHHNFFFAFLKEVFGHWPDTHAFQPRDEDYLRGWLLVKAGFSETMEFDWDFGANQYGRDMAIRMMKSAVERFSKGRPFWVKAQGMKIIAAWPRSIAFDKMDEEDFRRTANLVFAVIYAETGLDVEVHYQAYLEKHPALKVVPTRKINGRQTGNSPEDQARRF